MPPVRWKLYAAITVMCLLLEISPTDAQGLRDSISMTSDGWRPIIGTHKPHYYDIYAEGSDNIKAEVLSTVPPTQTFIPTTIASPGPQKKTHFRGSAKPSTPPGRKKNPHPKPSQVSPYYTIPSHAPHAPHIPLSAVTHTRPSQIGQIKKHPHPHPHSHPSNKPYNPNKIQNSYTSKRNVKPVRVQTTTHSHRDEIFTASATSGAYSFFNQAPPPNNIKTRETAGLGLPVTNHYSINQPHAHIEFNRFGLPSNENVFQQYNPVQSYVFPKHPQSNDINYQYHTQNDEYSRNLVPPPNLYKKETNQQVVKESENKPKILLQSPNIPENVIVQLPPPYQYTPQKSEPQIQVTKEKLNVFHNPPTYTSDYVDLDYHSVRKPTEISKPITYEVTEGKMWQEEFGVRQKPTPPPRRRPPEIELNTPPFLPTPYSPEGQGIVPTSPTQSEVSTIFTKLSKIQRHRATTPNPFGYNIKEVSTHYPIFGKPIFDPEISNEITTKQEEITTTTTEIPRIRPHRRRRPDRRTTTTTTTTEDPIEIEYKPQQVIENDAETERPIRRRPSRYRTTTPSSVESDELKPSRGRHRYRHEPTRRRRIKPAETTEYYQSSEESNIASEKSAEIDDNPIAETIEYELPNRHYVTELPKRVRYETIEISTTTEKQPTTNLVIPENEIDSTPTVFEESTTTPTTTTTSTTTPTTTTITSSHRIRRPIRYDNSNRPRFSVKEYRQKLSQYSSTTAPEIHRTRLPSRMRRPSSSTISSIIDEGNTEAPRTRFTPKEPRHTPTTEDTNEAIITEKNVRAINTRLRPFGRYKPTTPSTTTAPKVSIKPNLFARRRPPMISLRSKIYNKHKNTSDATTTEGNEIKDTTSEDADHKDLPTEASWQKTKTAEPEEDFETTTPADISKIDTYFYSQKVSELTSSAKNEYNTPGLFKSVSPTSRRIPNHFTIATDDPILPIEAFFPNLKDKVKDKDS